MEDISIRELIDLVTADVADSESRIQRMYEWHFEREMTICKWVLGVAVSLGIAFLVALLKAEISLGQKLAVTVGASIGLTALYGFYRLRQVRTIHRQFVVALRLHAELGRIGPGPFLKQYRIRRV